MSACATTRSHMWRTHSCVPRSHSCERPILYQIKRLLEISHQITPILNANRDANQPVGNSRCRELFFGKARMRGGLGMAHQRFHPAQRYRVARDAQIAEKLERGPLASAQIDGKHAARKIALLARDLHLLGIGE